MSALLTRVALVALAALALAGTAAADEVAVVVVPPFSLDEYAGRGAVGLLVPGSGESVTRAGALEALGVEPSSRPKATTIYVSLPPPGRHQNDRRYPIAVVGNGFDGVLESDATRLPGLVAIDDVAPTVAAIAESRTAPIGSTTGTVDEVRRLDVRLRDQLRARNGAAAVLALAPLLFCLLALALSSAPLARAGLLAAPLTVAVAVVLSAVDVTRPAALLPVLALLAVGLSLVGGVLLDARGVAVTFVLLIAAYLVVLVAKPAWPALAAVGPNPAQAGRFYGTTNTIATIVLAVGLFAAGTLGRRSLPAIALLSVITIGWSEAGADGGGMLVLVAAFATLWLLLSRGRVTLRAGAAAAGLAVAAGLALVGIDAATGGSSHVTRRVGDGPGALLRELGHRLEYSADRLTGSWHAALVFAVAIAALILLARRPPRFPVGDALLVGIAVSLLVNDTPQHVAAAGAISYAVLWAHERVGLADARSPR